MPSAGLCLLELAMNQISQICKKYNIALCYLFGSQKDIGEAILRGDKREPSDPESDIDFGVLFKAMPQNSLETYATLSLELEDFISPFKIDLLFMRS